MSEVTPVLGECSETDVDVSTDGASVKPIEPERTYFAEIDGLRAVAVMLVILYHAGLGVSGGYVGVDVFFVISGYLITRIMDHDTNSGHFSLAKFWIRRVRRIIPAAIAMTVATLILGSFVLSPVDFKNLAISAIWQQLACSNVYFWSIGGYFDSTVIPKPLLHTWSLSIEEQYYLACPLFLALVRRRSRRTTRGVCAIIALVSLTLAVYLLSVQSTAAFYGLASRLWEFLLGSLCFVARSPKSMKVNVRAAISYVGGAAILIPAFWYTETTRFPGAGAIPPCTGAALFIWSNRPGTIGLGRLLSSRFIVAVGLMSYSIYLWHWPIFVFYGQRFGFHGIQDRLIAVAITFLVSGCSWKFVEIPFRERRLLANGQPLVLTHLGVAAAIVVACLMIQRTFAVLPLGPQEGNAAVKSLETDFPLPPHVRVIGAQSSTSDPLRFLVWGDSHAMAAALTVESLARKHEVRGAFAARSGFVPLLDVWNESPNMEGRDDQLSWGRQVVAFAVEHRIPVVIMIVRWDCKMGGPEEPYKPSPPVFIRDEKTALSSANDAQRVFCDGIRRTMFELKKHGTAVWIVRQPPVQPHGVIEGVKRTASWQGKCDQRGVSAEDYFNQQLNFENALTQCSDNAVRVVGPADALFDKQGYTRVTDGRSPWYWDDDHVNEVGAEQLIRPLLDPLFSTFSQ